MNHPPDNAIRILTAKANNESRVAVARIEVHALQIFIRCPGCDSTLDVTVGDPRGLLDVQCPECLMSFDIPHSAAVAIV